MGSLLQATTRAPTLPFELASLLQAAVALVLVAALAYVSLRFLAKRGIGTGTGTRMHIEERLPLDARSGLLVVCVEGRRLLLATHGDAPARLLLELPPAQDRAAPSTPERTAP